MFWPAIRASLRASTEPLVRSAAITRTVSSPATVPITSGIPARSRAEATTCLLYTSRSINPVVDVSNYVMLELGQPNHPYDIDRLGGRGLVVRRASAGETIVTLDGTAPVSYTHLDVYKRQECSTTPSEWAG